MSNYVEDLFSLAGRTALVTGASSGIGRQMSQALASAGAEVVLVARREDRLAEVVHHISDGGGGAVALPGDLGQREDITRIAAEAAKFYGAPDILVNAAGINPRQPTAEVSWDTWDATLHLNLSVPFFLARALVPGMQAKGGGNIINIASLQSFRAFADGAPYGASKSGVVQLTRAMAEAWSNTGIVANAIVPGFFKTELTSSIFEDPDKVQHHAGMTAVGRNGELADLDGATVFLASRAAAYITGQVLPVDGGYTAK
ncbi:MAG: SDR family oxidoreductase [Rhodospirillales bacterium]|nr:SDR family oxidoreductase [Rhodospirillales bacterium]